MTDLAATDAADCACDLDGDWWACIEGRVYGPCESEWCYGVCESVGACDHECHRQPA